MPLFAPVMMTRLPVSEGMSAAFHFSLISVLDVVARKVDANYSVVRCVQAASSSRLDEKGVHYLHVFVWLFVGGQIAALFEDDELSSSNCFDHVRVGERRDIYDGA